MDELILSAHVCGNADVFPKILELHVPAGARIHDATYGRGVFWRKVDTITYDFSASDLNPHEDFVLTADLASLPFEDSALDALVLDPPYAEGFFRNRKFFEKDYERGSVNEGRIARGTAEAYHAMVRDLYFAGLAEAKRVLRPSGKLIVRVQDEVSSARQWWTHVEVMQEADRLGFYCKDLFVVVRTGRPGPRKGQKRQVHARKNHGYFLVFERGKR